MVKKMVSKSSNVLNDGGLTGWSFGLVALIFSIMSPIVGLILSFVGLIVNRKERKYVNNMFTKTGKTLNVTALIISVLLILSSILISIYLPDIISQIGGL